MRPVLSAFSFPLLMISCATTQAYKPLPKRVVHARYVLVTTNSAYDLTNPHMMPDDRQAAVNVHNAIKKWGRYALAYDTRNTDLIILVRRGRIAESLPGVRVGVGSDTKPNIGADVPVDAGDPRDMMALYDAQNGGIDSAPLWRESIMNGLDPPKLALLEQLKEAVEAVVK
jgi:hypothetical protein